MLLVSQDVHTYDDTAIDRDGQAEFTVSPLALIETVTVEYGKTLQLETVLGKIKQDAVHGIERSGTCFGEKGDRDLTPTLPKSLTTGDGEQEQDEVAMMLARRENIKPPTYLDPMGVADPMVPTKIRCCLDITFNEKRKFDDVLFLEDFIWLNRNSYKRITDTINNIKNVFLDEKSANSSHQIYLRYASCFVKGSRHHHPFHEADDILLKTERDMEKELPNTAMRAIRGFSHFHPLQSFQLRVHCDYSTIDKQLIAKDSLLSQLTGKPFHQAIQEEYEDKMKVGRSTIKGQRYLSPADHKVLITKEIGRAIIEEDALSLPKLTSNEKAKLSYEVVVRPATLLQAACVYMFIPMRFLYHLLCEAPHMEQSCSDDPDNLPSDTPITCTDDLCNRYYERLTRGMHQFFPYLIRRDPKLCERHRNAVVPVRHMKERTCLGRGAFADVYEVDLDPYCQELSPDFKRTYALKEFRPRSRSKDAFQREMTMLLNLALFLPHPHILTHIIGWAQDETYYILYEKAHCNLRQHMQDYRGGDLSRGRTLWFFSQLRGLSDAVRRIHILREPDTDIPAGEPNPNKTGVIGCHHDIKPENILTFDLPRNLPTLKLSDFGAGKFSIVNGRNESGPEASENRVTHTYAGPESHHAMRDTGEKVTRPFDIWALGCVFLELLLWFLGIEFPDGQWRFEDMRVAKEYNPQEDGLDYFWQRERVSGDFELNQAVVYVLDMLQHEKCHEMRAFQELISLIRRMLSIAPRTRILASQLFHALDAIVIQIEAELDASPNRYSDTYKRNQVSSIVSHELVDAAVGAAAPHLEVQHMVATGLRG